MGCSSGMTQSPDRARQSAVTPAKPEIGRRPPVAAAHGNQAHLRRLAVGGRPLQAKLTIGAVKDPLEHEADAAADRVMGMADPEVVRSTGPAALQRKCAACEEEEKPVRRKTAGGDMAGEAAPPEVGQVLSTPGRALDPATHEFMASRFGTDFSDVRIHTDARAARSAEAVGARAYTVGNNVVFGAGQYDPAGEGGRRLLAHELAHVVQQGEGGVIRRFETSEVPKIALTPHDMFTQIRKLVDDATTDGNLNLDFLVEISGGQSAGRKIDKALGSNDPTIKSRLLTRYLYSCRCGLIDMRHFLQLMYIAQFNASAFLNADMANRGATRKGREHETEMSDKDPTRHKDPHSFFGAEDTPSNALGAFTGITLPGIPGPDSVFDAIKDTLTRCSPVGWQALSTASKDQILHFYGDQVPDPAASASGDTVPKNQNQTAVPDILPIAECGGTERSLPFDLDTSDSDDKTLDGKNFLGGSTAQTSASDMRAFVRTQRPEIIRGMPLSEKIRFLEKFLSWPIREADMEAIKKIYQNSTGAELAAEP